MVVTRRMAFQRKADSTSHDLEAHSLDNRPFAAKGAHDVAHASTLPPRARFGSAVGWAALAVMMGWRPLELAPVPPILFKICGLAGFAVIAVKLIRFKRWSDEIKHLPMFLIMFVFCIVELMVENWFVWSVAAGNMRKYDDTFVPLQDNVAITVKAMAQHSRWVHAVAHWHWAHIGNFLFTFICIPFSVLWEQVPYSGFGIAARGLAMHAFVRIVRTFAFLAVVMPNPRSPRCFASRFKPVPEGWWEYLKAGALAVRGSGGCNDLILSGHGCAWMITVMTFWTFYPHGPMKWVVSAAYVQSSIRTALEGYHYSVDFIMPAVICCLVYRELSWVYSQQAVLPKRPANMPPDPVSKVALGAVIAALAFVVINAFFVGA